MDIYAYRDCGVGAGGACGCGGGAELLIYGPVCTKTGARTVIGTDTDGELIDQELCDTCSCTMTSVTAM